MRVEPQGANECALATLAALAPIPLAKVREAACARAGVAVWADVVGKKNMPFHRIIRDTAFEFGGATLERHMGYPERAIPYGSTVKILGKRIRKLPTRGRGTVVCGKPGVFVHHIAPWENGLVYDPSNPRFPVTLKQFRAQYGHVKRITYEGTP